MTGMSQWTSSTKKDTEKKEAYVLLFMLLINRTKNNRAYVLEERLGEKKIQFG